jgi:hypothetical protein
VLISSSFLSHADWHTTQVKRSADIATQILPDAARHAELSTPHRSDATTPQQKAAQESAQAAKASNSRQNSHRNERHGNDTHGSDKRAVTHREDAARTQRNAEAQRRHARRAHQKSIDEAQRDDNQSTDQNPATPASRENEPSPFLAILGDVLPQDAPTGASTNANGTHAGPSGPTDPFSTLGQMAFSSGLAGGNAAASRTLNESAAVAGTQSAVAGNSGVADKTVAEKTSEAAVPSATDGSGAHSQTELSAAFDGAFATKVQATPGGPGTAQAQKQAEVAFAARIAERTATGAAPGLNDAQATIAASRFDATSTGGQSGENHHGAANSGEPKQTVQTVQPDASSGASPDQTASTTSAAQPDGRPASGAQNAAVRSASSQPNSQPATEPGAAAPALASHASTASPGVNAGAPVTAVLSNTAPAAGNSASAKAAQENRAPQFLEAQNEPNQRAGESVRDISLKLTNKDQSSVQVRLSERAGELHVSVRTPDAGLTRGLREGLSDLVGRLEESGYRAETWRPADNASTAQDQGRENPSQQHSSQQQNAGGSGTDSRQQQNPRDQQEPGAQTPQWVGELETSLQRSNSSWQASSTR